MHLRDRFINFLMVSNSSYKKIQAPPIHFVTRNVSSHYSSRKRVVKGINNEKIPREAINTQPPPRTDDSTVIPVPVSQHTHTAVS